MADFERFVEVISKKEDKRVVNVTVRPFVTDCNGDVWFTDLMLQEGDMLSGYTVNTAEPMLEEYDTADDYSVSGKRFFNEVLPPALSSISERHPRGWTTKSIPCRIWLPGAFPSEQAPGHIRRFLRMPFQQAMNLCCRHRKGNA